MNQNISIYLDESGDLGFDWSKSKTSRFFVITLLVCFDKKGSDTFRIACRRTIKNKINKNKKKNPLNELKASKLKLESKIYFLKHSPKDNWSIYSYILDKKQVREHLKKFPQKLYNYIAANLLKEVPLKEAKTIDLVLDKCKNSKEIKDFNAYLQMRIEGDTSMETAVNISHLNSYESCGLQAVDLFSWGILRKYSYKDTSWYDRFCDHIEFEEKFFEKK